MKFEGKDGVLAYYLMDVENRLGDQTIPAYRFRLGLLVRLLHDICSITEIEQVETKHLRQCVQHLSTVPIEQVWRTPNSGTGILAISTVNAYMRIWKAFFNWCYQEELIEKNPVTRLKLLKEPKKIKPAFTDELIEKMIAVCDTSTSIGFRDYVVLLLLLDTGIRLAEIAGLTLDDVHDGYIKVTGKGRRDREVGIHPDVSKLLWKYVHKYRKPVDPDEKTLFIGRRGPLSDIGIRSIVERIQRDSGLSHVKLTPHIFRHTHSKMYMENGGDIFKLSRELGHSSIQVTRLYLEDFGSVEARRDHNTYSPISFMHLNKQQKKRKKGGEK